MRNKVMWIGWPLKCSVFKLTLLSLAIAPASGVAEVLLDNQTRTFTSADPQESYRLINGAVLNLMGATALGVHSTQSTVNIDGGSVTVSTGNAVQLVNSDATLSGVQLTSTSGGGLVLSRQVSNFDPYQATVTDSNILGSTHGAQVNAFGTLRLTNSTVVGNGANGVGVRIFGGVLEATGGRIEGSSNGAWLRRESSAAPQAPQLSLNGTHLEGLSGSAILADSASGAIIELDNGATLKGGNGVMLEVTTGSSATMNVNRSNLQGNVQVAPGGSAALTLSQSTWTGDMLVEAGNASTITLNDSSRVVGRLQNIQTVGINDGSLWTLTADSSVENLVFNGGQVSLGQTGAYHQLDVVNLSGDGAFHMRSDFASGETDFLNVTGTSSGNHGLLVTPTGSEATVDSLRLVHTADGVAQFNLLNDGGKVEQGAYSYALKQDGTDWVLDRDTRTVAPITLSAMALFNTPITVAYGELSSLRSRMGELRYSEGRNAGLWMRGYGNQYNVSGSTSGAGYQQNQRGLSLGADMQLGESDWLLGVLAGSSRSDLNLAKGSSGSVDSYYLGGYATWLDRETGYYVDTVVKYNRYQNNAKVGMSDGSRSKGDYDTHGVSASVEAGKHIKLDDGYFVEPFAQVATVVVAGKDYSFSNGLRAEGDTAKSVLGKVGATVGKTIPLDGGGMLQPYLKAAYAHEFAQRNEVRVNDNRFNNDLSGSRGELGAGVAWQVSKQFQVHADVEYSNGKHIEQPYGVNLGVRFEF